MTGYSLCLVSVQNICIIYHHEVHTQNRTNNTFLFSALPLTSDKGYLGRDFNMFIEVYLAALVALSNSLLL